MTETDMTMKYRDYLANCVSSKELNNDWVKITTPFLDSRNDYIEVLYKNEGENYIISDDGYTLRNLSNNYSKKMLKHLNKVLNAYSIEGNDYDLFLLATANDFGEMVQRLVNAMLAVEAMDSVIINADGGISEHNKSIQR